jgi:predicted transcriptional regulator
MGKRYADDLRLVVVRLIEEGHTWPEAAELCGISLSSVGRYIRRYRNTGGECQGSWRTDLVTAVRCAVLAASLWRRCGSPTDAECVAVLTSEKVRCSPCSRAGRTVRGCGWLCSSHLLRCASRPFRHKAGTGKLAVEPKS